MINKISYNPYLYTNPQKYKPEIKQNQANQCIASLGITKPSFGHHPDFERLKALYNITASSFFRRGNLYGSASMNYINIENTFKEIFSEKTSTPKQFLIAGIADSQEPFSYLASINDINPEKNLSKVINLHTIDLQSCPSNRKLFKDSFLIGPWEAEYALSSFVVDPKNYGIEPNCHFRVNNEILRFLHRTYNNPEKSLWETRLQDAIKNYKDEKFDVISINNTLYYIEEPEEIFETLKHVYRILKPNGIFITDPDKYKYILESDVMENFDEIRPGIYKKIK